jgi:hypothetical protein
MWLAKREKRNEMRSGCSTPSARCCRLRCPPGATCGRLAAVSQLAAQAHCLDAEGEGAARSQQLAEEEERVKLPALEPPCSRRRLPMEMAGVEALFRAQIACETETV